MAIDEPAGEMPESGDPAAPETIGAGPESGSSYTVAAVVAAGGAALVGAALWAVIAMAGNLEIGWAAWGVGALIGVAALKAGGRGPAMGAACAVMAILSIFAGKTVSTRLTTDNYLDEMYCLESYDQWHVLGREALALPENPADDVLKEFMITYEFWDSEVWDRLEGDLPDDVKVEIFKIKYLPSLLAFGRDVPSFEEWRDQHKSGFWENYPLMTLVENDLKPIDIIFAVLGISTAYGVVARGYGRRRWTPATKK